MPDASSYGYDTCRASSRRSIDGGVNSKSPTDANGNRIQTDDSDRESLTTHTTQTIDSCSAGGRVPLFLMPGATRVGRTGGADSMAMTTTPETDCSPVTRKHARGVRL